MGFAKDFEMDREHVIDSRLNDSGLISLLRKFIYAVRFSSLISIIPLYVFMHSTWGAFFIALWVI